MNNRLEDILGAMEPNELDEILTDDMGAELPKGASRRIEKMALQKAGLKNKKRVRFNYRVWAPIAACLVLAVSLTGVAAAAEVREYNTAVDFFAENGLSAEGLSREDIKAVYRDISTNRFTNDKTVEVIRRSVPGVEILQEEPTPEELSALWNSNVNVWSGSHTNAAAEYKIDYEFPSGAEHWEWDKITVECLRDGETLWKTEFPTLGKKWGDDELYIRDCEMTSSGTAVWGQIDCWTEVTESSKSPGRTYGLLARIDDSGEKLWERRIDHGFEDEYIGEVIDNGDGTWAVVSRGDLEYLCLSQYDIDGNELSFNKTQVGNKGIWNAARLGDGYLVQLGDYTGGSYAHLTKLDRDGNITDNFVYEGDDCDYHITDMAEFEGRVYLSAYSVPKQTDGGGRYEIADILGYVFDKGNYEISSEELTPLVRDNYTAVLLLCDPEGGEPETFYSVKGALGGKLTVEDGRLKWDAESVVSTFYSPYTSSFSIGGTCRVYRYSFDSTGALVECDDTGETTPYHR